MDKVAFVTEYLAYVTAGEPVSAEQHVVFAMKLLELCDDHTITGTEVEAAVRYAHAMAERTARLENLA